MIREAIEYVTGLATKAEEPKTIVIGGRTFAHSSLVEVEDATQYSLELSSLTSMIEYVKSKFDTKVHAEALMIHVVSPTKVELLGPLVENSRTRYEYCHAIYCRNGLDVGNKYKPEPFNMALQMHCEDKHDRAALLKLSGTIGTEKAMTSHDDGITQQVSVRQGAVLESSTRVPNPVTLSPYRTFAEIEQPSSPFVFRVHDQGPDRLPLLSLSECDGGLWKHTAMQSIAQYMKAALPEITVLA